MLTIISWLAIRQTLMVLGLFALLWFAWSSHAVTLFNGLASPLFFALAAYLVFLASQYRIKVSRSSLVLFMLFAAWVVFVDARSGEFLPALAADSHWLVLPLASLLIAEVFREYPRTFEVVQVGAALCIIYLLLTLFTRAEWFDNWHYPPIFGHIRHLGLSIGLLSIFLYAKTDTTSWISTFFRLSRILGLALVFWSGTRASILAWLVCMVAFIFADRNHGKTLFLDSAAGFMLSLIPEPPLHGQSYDLMQRSLLEVLQRTHDTKTLDSLSSLRLSIWKSTISGLIEIEKLWTGVGGNGFARLQVAYGVAITPPRHVHAHNFIVQSICDWGLIGLGLFTAFIYQSTLKPVIAAGRKYDPTAMAAIIYLVVTGMLDATLYHLEHLTYLAIALAYLISKRCVKESNNIHISGAMVVVFIVTLALIHMLAIDYRIGLFWYFPTQ
jgi:hypothetical protein